MSYDILKNLGLERADASAPDFLRTLERMQREAWERVQREDDSQTCTRTDQDLSGS